MTEQEIAQEDGEALRHNRRWEALLDAFLLFVVSAFFGAALFFGSLFIAEYFRDSFPHRQTAEINAAAYDRMLDRFDSAQENLDKASEVVAMLKASLPPELVKLVLQAQRDLDDAGAELDEIAPQDTAGAAHMSLFDEAFAASKCKYTATKYKQRCHISKPRTKASPKVPKTIVDWLLTLTFKQFMVLAITAFAIVLVILVFLLVAVRPNLVSRRLMEIVIPTSLGFVFGVATAFGTGM
jgi:hypothetical protein